MTETVDISIGPFTLGEPLGEGGMGVVHHARHRRTGVAVAMKFLSAYDRHALRDAFHREVQLVAGLSHPGIIEVLDYGSVGEHEVPPHAAMKPGDPWLAMELANRGSLRDVRVGSWDELRWVLLSVLDALAHAHARGVIHRDLKPANILVTDRDGRRSVQLADFGIAHLRRETLGDSDVNTTSPESAGTPHFMAPEQIRGEWRDFGAWTDLYALGCVAYRLATGRYLFAGNTPFMIWDQHLRANAPALRARYAVPPGFEAWVHRLLSKHPRDRFRRAADAAWVLRSMGEPEGELGAADDPEPIDDTGVTRTLVDIGFDREDFSIALGATLSALSQTAPLDELVSDAPSRVGGQVDVVAPMPSDWRGGDPPRSSAYADVGLGLLGMRAVPLVGRQRERDAMWAHLSDVRDMRTRRFVTIAGEAGVGKTAIARWLCHRAHEVAGASVLHVMHDVENTPATGLVAAIDRYTDCEGLDGRETWERLRGLMAGRCSDPARRAAAMTEVLRPGLPPDDGIPPVVLASATERAIALRDGLSAIVGSRPMVLWLDDAHLESAAPTLDALPAFTSRDSDLATLVVATVRDVDDRFDALDPTKIELAKVDDDALRDLLKAMLPVSERAALAIIERCEGVPLFAVHLLADWARSGRLVARDRGFEVDDLDQGGLPADIGELWRTRVGTLVAESPAPERWQTALAVAATLGRDVRMQELTAACEQLGVEVPEHLVDGLIRRGLATPRKDGFSFAHTMLADVVARELRTDQEREIHGACADAVDATAVPGDHDRLLRVARHRLAAGQHEQAIDGALRSIELSWADDRAARSSAAIALIDAAAEALALPANDPRVVRGELWRIRGFRVRWDFDEVKPRARDLIVTAASDALEMERAEALVELGLAEGYGSGELQRALPHFEAAAQVFERLDATKSHAEVLSRLAYVHRHADDPDAAIAAGEACVELYREVSEPDGLARGLVALAHAIGDSDPERVGTVFEEANDVAAAAGLRYWQANVLYGLANLDEHARRYHTAIDRLRESAKICIEIGSTAVDACRTNLACLLVLTGAIDEAALLLRELEQRGTLPQLWKKARYAALVLAERAGDAERSAELRAQIMDEPVDDETTRALFAMARND